MSLKADISTDTIDWQVRHEIPADLKTDIDTLMTTVEVACLEIADERTCGFVINKMGKLMFDGGYGLT